MELVNWNPMEPRGIAGEIGSAANARLKFARLTAGN